MNALKILVTGATGFIGKGLLPRLIADGHSVRAALRMPTSLLVEAISVGEIGPETEWAGALDGIGAVIHLAGRAHILGDDAGDPLPAFRRVNVDGTRRLAAQAERAGVRRFILVSSVKAAAEMSPGRALTEADPPAPRTPYGLSKWEAEQALRRVAHKMEFVILRPPLVYGPGVGANFQMLLRMVGWGLPLPFGAVRNRRSLVARDNLVDAIATTLTAPAAANGVFYVTDGPALSTPGLIRRLADALGHSAPLFPFPPSLIRVVAGVAGRAASADSLLGSLEIDNSAFRKATGWQPPVLQDVALRGVAEWYKTANHRD